MSATNRRDRSLRDALRLGLSAALVGLAIPHSASASGFLDNIQSATDASVSSAGSTAIAEDAATVYYNAAGMALLDRPQILASSGIVFPSGRFTNAGTADALGDRVRGSTDVKDQVFPAPSLFAAVPISDRIHIGLGVFAPFGQINKYADGWVGRYQLQSISLKSIDIDPAAAYRVSDSLSVGGGVDIEYAHLVRKNAIDFGSLCFLVGACPGLGLLPQGADGRLTADVDSWSVGYNIGALYQPSGGTHVGINYRSAVRHDFSGIARFDVPAAAAPLTAGGSVFRNTSARSTVTFPDVIAAGLSQKIDDRLTALVDVDGTLWSHLKTLTLDFGNALQPVQTLRLNWHDTVRVAVGGIYRVTDSADLRAGVSFDQSPVPSAFRSADLPDSDRLTLSIGLTYRFDAQLSATVSYSYDRYAAAPVNLSMLGAGTLLGAFHRTASALGLQASAQF